MPKTIAPLNDRQIKNAKPKEVEYSLADGQGLYLRIRPNGAMQWLLKYYKPHSNARTNMSFGTYPEVTLAEARQKRLEARTLLAKGIDPQHHRDETTAAKEQAHANTLERIAARWFALKKTKVTPAYAADIWRSLELHILPTLGKQPITALKPAMVIKAIHPIAAKGNLETVKRLCQRINEVMVHALNIGLIEANPLAGIYSEFLRPTKKNMLTLKPDELPELMQAINQASIKRLTRCLIEWQLHTMVRPSEAAGAK